MTRALLPCCVALCAFFAIVPARAGEPAPALSAQLERAADKLVREGWADHGLRDGVRVLSRESPGSRVRTVRALTVMAVSAARLVEVVTGYEDYPAFVPYVAQSVVTRREGEAVWLFQQLDLPWPVSNRYYTVRITPAASAGGVRRFEWALAQDPAYRREGRGVALPLAEGFWEVTQPGPEPVTLAVYQLHADPGGWLPAWVIDIGYRRLVPAVVNALRERARGG